MKVTNYNKFSALFWNKLNYKQKICVYRLVNNVVAMPTEKYLNYWWHNVSIYRRDEIISDIMEILK